MPATSTGVVFTEAQSLERLAEQAWCREGQHIVSLLSYGTEAVSQYGDALSEKLKGALQFRGEAAAFDGPYAGSERMVMDGRGAETEFARHGLVLRVKEIAVAQLEALERLAQRVWERQGRMLVSRDRFSPKAVSQHADGLGELKHGLRFGTETGSYAREFPDSKHMVMDAARAEETFGKHGLTLNLPERSAGNDRGR